MFAIVGLVVLFVCVFGGYIMAGGSMAPIIKAAPIETFIIAGAGVAGMLVGNGMDVIKGVGKGIGKVFKGPAYKKDDYLSTIFVVAKIMKTLKTEGAVALEAHIENPEASAIFGEYPKLLHDHALLHLITDTVRLMVVSSSNLSPYAVEEVMDQSMKTHHHGELKVVDAIATLWCATSTGYRGLRAWRGQDYGPDRPTPCGTWSPNWQRASRHFPWRVYRIRFGGAHGQTPGTDRRGRGRDLQGGQADHYWHHARSPHAPDHRSCPGEHQPP